MNNTLKIERQNRLSIPGKIINTLFNDDTFFREVASSKKISLQNFPKYDQWFDGSHFFMEFALAGYSADDILVEYSGSTLTIKNKDVHDDSADLDSKDERDPKSKIHHGVIVRGIARRRFKSDFYISEVFNLSEVSAAMENGLLKIKIPIADSTGPVSIDIKR